MEVEKLNWMQLEARKLIRDHIGPKLRTDHTPEEVEAVLVETESMIMPMFARFSDEAQPTVSRTQYMALVLVHRICDILTDHMAPMPDPGPKN